jgi:hypothetical protein
MTGDRIIAAEGTNALAGQQDLLKERIIGFEVFGKVADYDTNAEPVVRVTAAEIRRRLEQYYQEAGHDTEIRLLLPAGSYVPQLSLPGHLANALMRPGGIPRPAPRTIETKSPRRSSLAVLSE